METVKWSPFRDMEALERRVRRLFDEPLLPALPAADVYETEGEFVVELEVPGFEEKDLAIEIGDHTLSVTGTRSTVEDKEDKSFRLHERLEASFARRFDLPGEADTTSVEAGFEQGVLTIRAPKLEDAKPRRVEIGSAA